ncbi:MAG: endonuclease V, partial [Dehalococcoidales bacterium]
MKTNRWHEWQLSVAQARDMQRRLSLKVSRSGEVISPRLIAGVDVAAGRAQEIAKAAVVVLSFPELRLVE